MEVRLFFGQDFSTDPAEVTLAFAASHLVAPVDLGDIRLAARTPFRVFLHVL